MFLLGFIVGVLVSVMALIVFFLLMGGMMNDAVSRSEREEME